MAAVLVPAPRMRATEIITCPPLSAGGLVHSIRTRGNVPVAVGGDCIFEMTQADIDETWSSTCALKLEVAGAMAAELGHRLCEELRSETLDSQAIASEAAACLFLALRHHNIPLLRALAGCRITFDDRRRREAVEYLA